MKFVPNAVSAAAARAVLSTQKSSPKVLFVAGVVGMGATVVLACRATLQVEDVLDKVEANFEKIETGMNVQTADNPYTEADAKRDKVVVCVRAAGELTVLYAPALIVGALSIAALTGSHNILTQRNAALTAAYGTVSKAFDEYRGRVRNQYGEEREKEIYNDVQICEIEDPATGKKSKTKMAQGGAPYSFLFDEHNQNFETTPEYNFMFLKMKQTYFTQRLRARGHLFLNEVLEELGFEHTKAGAVTGWIRGNGDDYVDFGIFENDSEQVTEFMIGREKAIWLTFNVDGTIYDKI